MPVRKETEMEVAVKGGFAGGLVGGVVLAIFMLISNLAGGTSVWAGMKGSATPLLGERAMEPAFEAWPVFLGLLTHFSVSLCWGLLFGVVAYGLSKAATLGAGVAYGVLVWLAMFYAVLPLVGLGEVARSMPVAGAIFEHVLFGVSVAIGFLPFQRHRKVAAAPEGERAPV